MSGGTDFSRPEMALVRNGCPLLLLKDADACWTVKHGVVDYGYKTYGSVDREFGLVRGG